MADPTASNVWNEEEEIRGSQGGDREAFGRLVVRHQHRVFHVCLGLLGNPDEADDICQETFVRAFRKIGQFRGEAALSTWLIRIAIHACRSYQRKQALRRMLGMRPELRRQAAEDVPDPAVSGEEQERFARLRAAIQKLPRRQREIVVLKHFEEKTIAEIGRMLGLSEGTVKHHLFEAAASLRKILEKERTGP